MENRELLSQLVTMSRFLGEPSRRFAILGEGNTSCRIDDEHFYIKASGTTLETIQETDFISVRIAPLLEILDSSSSTDADVQEVLKKSKCNPEETRMPSVETMLHAVLYQYPEYRFIGHTHPIAVNSILCSNKAEEYIQGRTCPDHVVVLGRKSVFVQYVDPGLELAQEVRRKMKEFVEKEGFLPRAIFLENHGLIAMGPTPSKVQAITQMAEKCAEIVLGSALCGGPKFLSNSAVLRIDTRPDEHYRQKML
ncbi:MAG: class II aldolase/adducin family protein [Candidatus Hydrogenedentes bacterium]|nr:class II aldolase/adducin family protein [Candidatus Hydrogenedentota bacterium]